VSGIEVLVTETTKIAITLKPRRGTKKSKFGADHDGRDEHGDNRQSITTETVRNCAGDADYQQLLTLSSGAQSELNASAQLGRANVRSS